MVERVTIGILGASGYTGAELLRLLASHPRAEVRLLTADRQAGKPIGAIFPHLGRLQLPELIKIEDADFGALDAVFCCLPHATTQRVVRELPSGLRVVDLSADFRLRDTTLYEETYKHPHEAPELQQEAVYGLTEQYRDAIRSARLVANPGCYTTTAELPLVPLLKNRLIDEGGIIIDAKSGVSGAGREAKTTSLFTEVAEGIQAYGVATHRHAPEIEQCLSDFSREPVRVVFTPHLMPMNRGILATIYVEDAPGTDARDIHAALAGAYAAEPFVHVLGYGEVPATRDVRGSNDCVIGVRASRAPGRTILIAVLDNLVKGASGQALQNMNAMLGLEETMGLVSAPLFP